MCIWRDLARPTHSAREWLPLQDQQRKEARPTLAMVNLKINDQSVSAPVGSTVLQAAWLAGIDIPTLCDHLALAPVGACRMCLVEIMGQRAL